MKNFKIVCSVVGGLQVAGVRKGGIGFDNSAAFSFQIQNCDCAALADALKECNALRSNHETYWDEHTFVVGNNVEVHYRTSMCSIIVNKCRVAYHDTTEKAAAIAKAIDKELKKQGIKDSLT